MTKFFKLPAHWWANSLPLLACLPLLSEPASGDWGLLALSAIALLMAVQLAVFHAEIIAHRLGEPFGTLVLALAITVIEVALIISVMLGGTDPRSALARDTVFATVMIICNGVVGLCLLAGAIRHRILVFRIDGTGSALAVLTALTTLTLVLPEFTTSTAGPTYAPAQMIFAGLMALVLYAVFVFVQTIRHKDLFLNDAAGDADQTTRPDNRRSLLSLLLLVISLVAVVGLAKQLAPAIERAVAFANAPPSLVGILIALLVLLPETQAALGAALRNRMQTSLNLALGSALATIGLTIPSVVAVALWMDLPLILGLPPKEIVLLTLTLVISTMTLASGRATLLQGAVHLVVFAAFLFLAIVP